MMRIIKFVKWLWRKSDEFTRIITCFVLFWMIPCAIAVIWVGKDAAIAAFIGAGVVIGGRALYGVFCLIRDLWNKFNDENPSEEIAIIRRLKGIPTPSQPESEYYD